MQTHTVSIQQDMSLRIRKPALGTKGNISLLSMQGDFWDCVECFEHKAERYTDTHWVDKFHGLYGFDGKDDMQRTMLANEDEASFKFKRSDYAIDPDRCKLSERGTNWTVNHSLWDPKKHTLELQLVETFEGSEDVIGYIEYTSLLLVFKDVPDINPRAGKRQRS